MAVTLRCEDANSKLVELVTVADVDAEDHVGTRVAQIVAALQPGCEEMERE